MLTLRVTDHSQTFRLVRALGEVGFWMGRPRPATAVVEVGDDGVIYFCNMDQLSVDIRMRPITVPDDIAVVLEGITVPHAGEWQLPLSIWCDGRQVILRPAGPPQEPATKYDEWRDVELP